MTAAETLPAPLPVAGVRLASAAAGIRYRDRDDLVLVEIAPGASTAAVFTRNAFCAAPVQVARAHLAAASPRYLLINAGNANAGTGQPGLEAAHSCCALVARQCGCAPAEVLPFSTGVIGEPLPLPPFADSLPALAGRLDTAGWGAAARAIMTTDTRPKVTSRCCTLQGRQVTLTGMSKGSGMICPDMATMLAFVATDAALPPELLQTSLQVAADDSFNAITIDGDTSTNDACVLIATGTAGVRLDATTAGDLAVFQETLTGLCQDLARAIVLDGEGATKLVEIEVEQAASTAEARQVGYTIAHSPLVKTALFAADPNWGRILAAVGRAGMPDLAIDAVTLWLGEVCIVRDGGRDPDYTEAAGQQVMARPAITIRVVLARGQARARLLTCDLSYDYVKINAEYRS